MQRSIFLLILALQIVAVPMLSAQAPATGQSTTDTATLLEALKRPQPWSDRTGRVFIGIPKSISNGTVVFSRSGGQDVTVPLASLSEVSVIALHCAFNGMAIPPLPEAAGTPLAAAPQPAVPSPAPAAAPAPAPMTPPPAGGAPLDVANTDGIKAALNTQATVEGKVKSVSTLSGGQMRINFHGTNDFVIFVPKRAAEAPEWGFDTMAEAMIRATGKIVEYNGKLEIVAENFTQVQRVP